MKLKFANLIAMSALVLMIAGAQSTTSTTTLTNDQVKYFVSFFSLMGDPNLKESFPSHREVSVRSIFGMNEADASALRLSVGSYTAQMTQILNSERAIISGKAGLTDPDRAAVAQLIQMRDQMVSSLAGTLLVSLRPQTATQILADAQHIINIRNGKGAK